MSTVQWYKYLPSSPINLSPHLPWQKGHFADDVFRCIFANEKFHILIKTSLRFVPKGPIDNNPALPPLGGFYASGQEYNDIMGIWWVYNGLAPNRGQVIIWTNVDPVPCRIYTALGGGGYALIANTFNNSKYWQIFPTASPHPASAYLPPRSSIPIYTESPTPTPTPTHTHRGLVKFNTPLIRLI